MVFGVIGWRVGLVPKRLSVRQAESLMDLNHCAHAADQQEAACLTRLLLIYIIVVLYDYWLIETRF